MVALLLLAQGLNPGVMPKEPSVVPMLLQPGSQQTVLALPGGRFGFERPNDAREVGRDEARGLLVLAIPVGRQFCEFRLTTMAMPSGNVGSFALSQATRLRAIPGAHMESARRVAPGLLRQAVRFNLMGNPSMPRFITQWLRLDAGFGLLIELEGPGAFEPACIGRAQTAAMSVRRL